MKSIVIALLIASLAVLGVVVVRQQNRVKELEKVAAEKPVVVEDAHVSTPPPSPPRIEAEPVVVPPVTAPTPTPPPPPVIAQPPPKPANIMAHMSSMMTNPAMREMVRAQSKVQLAMQYQDLFEYLSLPPDAQKALSDLLMERQMELMTVGLAMMSGDIPPEERKKRSQDVENMKKSYDSRLAELLGTENYDVFKQYEDTQPERQQVQMFKQTLVTSGQPLTEQQENDLVVAMYSTRTNTALSKMMTQTTPDPDQFTGEKANELMTHMEKLQQEYIASAGKILTPQQLEQYKQFAAQQQELSKLGMKMAEQMFGAGKPAAAP